ncbi:MAG: hypothetical protein AABW64_00395 [Nanoarchaeota archaeon]
MLHTPNSRHAQLNTEYIFLTLLILLFILPVIYYGLQISYENYRLLQSGNILFELTSAAEDVNQLGAGNKQTVVVEIPNGITGAVVKGNVLSIKSDTHQGQTPLIRETRPQVVGSFLTSTGRQFISVTALNQYLVRIGEGLALFSTMPFCVSPTQLPMQITLLGDEIDATTQLLKDGVPYPSNLVTFVNRYTLQFTATTNDLPPKLNSVPYSLQLQKNNEISNPPILFYSYPASNFCGTFNPLLSAERYAQATHTYLEEVTTNVAKDDGYYSSFSPTELVHLSFTNTLRQGDFLTLSFFCSSDGTISLLREGASTVLGTLTCTGGSWQTARLFITVASSPSSTFDLVFDTSLIDYDYIGGFTI